MNESRENFTHETHTNTNIIKGQWFELSQENRSLIKQQGKIPESMELFPRCILFPGATLDQTNNLAKLLGVFYESKSLRNKPRSSEDSLPNISSLALMFDGYGAIALACDRTFSPDKKKLIDHHIVDSMDKINEILLTVDSNILFPKK